MGCLWDILIRGVPEFSYRSLSGHKVALWAWFAEELQPTLAESQVLAISKDYNCRRLLSYVSPFREPLLWCGNMRLRDGASSTLC